MSAGLTNGTFMVLAGSSAGVSYEIFDPATGIWSLASLPEGSSHNMAMLLYNGKVLYLSWDPWLYNPRDTTWVKSLANILWSSKGCGTLLKNGQVLLMYNSGQSCVLYDHITDTEIPVQDAAMQHQSATETLLPNGNVLVCGAFGTGSEKCELFDVSTNTWSYVESMSTERHRHVSVLLPPPWNKVLVAGDDEECELYDPDSASWEPACNLNEGGRAVGTMALLPSGKPLMMGGVFNEWSCEFYDADADTWFTTDDMNDPRKHFVAAVLYTGKVLAADDYAINGSAEIYDPSDGNWEARASLHYKRAAHTVTPLPIVSTANCSTNVLVVGGENSTGAIKYCEFYNYSLELVSITDSLENARSHHTAVLLADADVLVAGGKDGAELSSSELYRVSTQAWTTTGPLSNARYDHTATLLKNGKVLVTGGESASGELASCEVYGSGTWTPTGDMTAARTYHSAVLLLDSTVLVIGGNTAGSAISSCEIWDGTSWSGTGSLATARYWHSAVLLQSGKVLVIGGTGDGSIPIASCEIYDPDAGTWSYEADLNYARYLHNSSLLYSGLILATGGQDASGYLSSSEVYDPALHQWKDDTSAVLSSPRAYHSSVLIPDTMPFVLAIGGTDGSYLNSIEEYDVGLGYRSIWQSTITNHPSIVRMSDSMHIDGTLFRGVSEADGGNYCHISSNDHPVISYVRVGGGNWQGNGGGEILHMPLSSSWDTAHTDVHPEIADFQGYYRLWSIVNGIPCKWYGPCTPSGVKEDSRSRVQGARYRVYPNPTTAAAGINLQLPTIGKDSRINLTIYDLSGRVLRSMELNAESITEQTIKLSGLQPGIYFYKINNEDHELKGKFTVVE
jgi:N-acetylneuraminic acid mutarotase